ncbi:MAG: TetR/AcrR family transcriptional regulator [Cyanobacteria bacterium CRU_2_1]|nr:TetR/AcrR family transcriptional regulator [Cyanobacteria bacterium RU_5_0]NJR62307.1 TetR/AcrR family transcriptional regulator [Cyanobacteria bacterium CRU_2_1]
MPQHSHDTQIDESQPQPLTKDPSCRRRSQRCHQAILSATIELLEEKGYSGVSVEAIAARAGVGKQTIYRWWTCKAGVIMEAYADYAAKSVPMPETGSVKEDLRQILHQLSTILTTTSTGAALAGLIAEAQANPEMADVFREKFVASRRAMTRTILERGIERGELRPDFNMDVAIDVTYGPVWYRLLIKHAPLDETFVEELVTMLMVWMQVQ